MKPFPLGRWIPLLMLLVVSAPSSGWCQDMRELQVQARQAREALLQKAAAEERAARQEAERSKAHIAQDRSTLAAAVASVEEEVKSLKAAVKSLEDETTALEKQEDQLTEELATSDSLVRELVGVVRVNAKDLNNLIQHNLQSALSESPTDFLTAIADQGRFPGLQEIDRMLAVLWEQIRGAGHVRITRGPIVDRAGSSITAEILVLGNFTAAYRTPDEVGFLNYLPAGRKLFALSKLPPGHMQKQLRQYMQGRAEAVPMDISRGAALGQLTHAMRLWQQIPKGGPLVWPILAVLALGVVIVVERVVFLLRKRMDADDLTRRIETMAARQDWQACRKACATLNDKPVARVVAAGLTCCHMSREAMENALQEAILREVPPLERFLSTLGMLAAIAPLLGLLGTVTGMINTFHVITRFGTGDPRMMSGGISEALVTTMLGLSVAIPIMLAHTLLNRAVDKHVGRMEEKAVALVNIVHKSHAGDH
jgi:biopolymer transport protein ExbB